MPRGGRKHHKKPKEAVPKKEAVSKKEEPKEESDHDDGMALIDAYNFADTIQTDWESSAVPPVKRLKIEWFDSSSKVNVEDEEASETESIVDHDAEIERSDKLFMDEPGHGGHHEDCAEDDDEEEDLEDFYMWPKTMDSIAYQLADELHLVRFLMNKPERKVYFARRKSDDLPVVVIVGQEFDPRLRDSSGIPREVRIMRHLKGQQNIAEILGWCRATNKHFVIVLRHYNSADMIDASAGNLFIISKIMESIFLGVKQMHDNKVVHRDIAKSNILWNPLTDTATIIDFDNAAFYRPTGYYRNVGRDKYDSPEKTEMLEIREKLKEKMYADDKKKISHKNRKHMRAYTEKAEMYSLGVILWMLLNEKHHSPSPYKLKTWVTKMKERNKHKKYTELDLLVKLLNFDPDLRITVDDALEHPFIKNRPDDEPDQDYLHMKAYLFKQLGMQKEYDQLAKQVDDDQDEKKVGAKNEDEESSESESAESVESGESNKNAKSESSSESSSGISSDHDDDEVQEDKSHIPATHPDLVAPVPIGEKKEPTAQPKPQPLFSVTPKQ